LQPKATEPHVDLAVAHNSAALFANERGDHAAAAEHAQKAIEHQSAALANEPDERLRALLGQHQANLAYALSHLGRTVEALVAAREVTKNAPGKIAALRMAAEAAAYVAAPPPVPGAVATDGPASGRDDEGAMVAAAALDCIFAVNRKEARRLLDDKRFASLRDHPAFQRLRERAAERP
jgi:tetratricopeptide (TPR) repeat protein